MNDAKDWMLGNETQRKLQAQDAKKMTALQAMQAQDAQIMAQKEEHMKYKFMDHENLMNANYKPPTYTLRDRLNERMAALEKDTRQAQDDYKKAEKLGILDMNADELHRLFGSFL